MKPRIGLTTSSSLHDDRFLEALERAYVTAVVEAGGVPFLLPALDPAEVSTVAACLDGIFFTGGGDVDPAVYGAPESPHATGVDAGRDAYELALAHHGLEQGLPMLGICRGCQVINVAMGGTLVPHLPEVTDQEHCVRDRFAEAVHTVDVVTGSRLHAVTGLTRIGVNTLHHQAVDRVADGLVVVGRADDGVIEAVEGAGARQVLGVQWHPELLPAEPGHAELFGWLVDTAARRLPQLSGSAQEKLAASHSLADAAA